MPIDVRRPSVPQFCASVLMVVGVMLMRSGPPHPYIPGQGMSLPPWQTIAGVVLCLISAGWHIWLRPSPYSGPDSTDPDSLTTLDLDRASDSQR
jgi:hypothetical protein